MATQIGILLSGRGSNFEALAASAAAGRLGDAEIALVISNREGAPGIDRARERKIPALVIPSRGLEREEYDRLVVSALRQHEVELVCLAGFMRLLSPYFIKTFPNRILNIHPSLLPSFPGPGSATAGARIRRALCGLHGTLGGRKSRRRADHPAGGDARAG